jgi:hypothetical protein
VGVAARNIRIKVQQITSELISNRDNNIYDL